MKTNPTRRFALFLLLAGLVLGQSNSASAAGSTAAPAEAPEARPDATAAIDRGDEKFTRMHKSFLERGKAGPIGVLFLGDSITEGWGWGTPYVWEHHFGKYQPANFGIGGDQTQNVIWRIENGELDGISPKVVVLMLGTNNVWTHTPAEIAAGDRKIVEMIRARLPKTKVLLLGVFPRGPGRGEDGKISEADIADAAHRQQMIREVNAMLAKLDDGANVRYLDIGHVFLGQDGRIPFSIMPDQLHLSPAGYVLWAEAIGPVLAEMMK